MSDKIQNIIFGIVISIAMIGVILRAVLLIDFIM